ncbi:DKNYY domain-containing protein [Chitinophaga sp. CC14]|uniref:DKNYY domain-containing protein n=1 Tax=Chitinophaga sp. CC14 TaxID=3029199 RepID=UPI003B7DB6E7
MFRWLAFLFCCVPVCLFAQSNLTVDVGDTEVTFHSTSAFGLRGSRSQTLKPKDIASFRYLGGAFSKDKFQVYFYKSIVQEANPASFFCLGSRDSLYPEFNLFPKLKSVIGADEKNIYFMPDFGPVGDYVDHVTVMDRKTFGIVTVLDSMSGSYLVRDGKNLSVVMRDMYDRTNIVPTDLEEKNITLIGGGYFLNGQILYYQIFPIYKVKPGSMKVYAGSKYITDGKKVYYYQYNLDPLVADHPSFKVHPVYKAFAKDKKDYYFKGEKISSSFYAFEVAKKIFSTADIEPADHRRYLDMCAETN